MEGTSNHENNTTCISSVQLAIMNKLIHAASWIGCKYHTNARMLNKWSMKIHQICFDKIFLDVIGDERNWCRILVQIFIALFFSVQMKNYIIATEYMLIKKECNCDDSHDALIEPFVSQSWYVCYFCCCLCLKGVVCWNSFAHQSTLRNMQNS